MPSIVTELVVVVPPVRLGGGETQRQGDGDGAEQNEQTDPLHDLTFLL